ncbi:nitroreductase [Syntrophobotulus glycolicus DSM 8271]|uniref:Nitroreductase n=1 Tax=Syntrophobotulus glycolicus (strain DSM 8271 / FlGlyR) TaxID=645991 RepID=F0T1Z8_SYNGF|nr:nitroreductase family protein [Syntrophobotulus glycolicus]ADY56342.1 nitroreductase [Syntrophobotulus glycolicus DSM 8271]
MLDIMANRRSIRKYQEIAVEQEKVDAIIKAALLAPSGNAIYPTRFFVVNDKELIVELAKAREVGSSFLKNAPLCIVVSADPQTTDAWIEDSSIAATYIQLSAQALGLGSCWVQVRNRKHSKEITSEDYVRKILNIPECLKLACIIGIGYPDEQKEPHADERLRRDHVYANRAEQE